MSEKFEEGLKNCDHECTRIKTERIIEKTLETYFNEQRGSGYHDHADPFSRKVIDIKYHCSICGKELSD